VLRFIVDGQSTVDADGASARNERGNAVNVILVRVPTVAGEVQMTRPPKRSNLDKAAKRLEANLEKIAPTVFADLSLRRSSSAKALTAEKKTPAVVRKVQQKGKLVKSKSGHALANAATSCDDSKKSKVKKSKSGHELATVPRDSGKGAKPKVKNKLITKSKSDHELAATSKESPSAVVNELMVKNDVDKEEVKQADVNDAHPPLEVKQDSPKAQKKVKKSTCDSFTQSDFHTLEDDTATIGADLEDLSEDEEDKLPDLEVVLARSNRQGQEESKGLFLTVVDIQAKEGEEEGNGNKQAEDHTEEERVYHGKLELSPPLDEERVNQERQVEPVEPVKMLCSVAIQTEDVQEKQIEPESEEKGELAISQDSDFPTESKKVSEEKAVLHSSEKMEETVPRDEPKSRIVEESQKNNKVEIEQETSDVDSLLQKDTAVEDYRQKDYTVENNESHREEQGSVEQKGEAEEQVGTSESHILQPPKLMEMCQRVIGKEEEILPSVEEKEFLPTAKQLEDDSEEAKGVNGENQEADSNDNVHSEAIFNGNETQVKDEVKNDVNAQEEDTEEVDENESKEKLHKENNESVTKENSEEQPSQTESPVSPTKDTQTIDCDKDDGELINDAREEISAEKTLEMEVVEDPATIDGRQGEKGGNARESGEAVEGERRESEEEGREIGVAAAKSGQEFEQEELKTASAQLSESLPLKEDLEKQALPIEVSEKVLANLPELKELQPQQEDEERKTPSLEVPKLRSRSRSREASKPSAITRRRDWRNLKKSSSASALIGGRPLTPGASLDLSDEVESEEGGEDEMVTDSVGKVTNEACDLSCPSTLSAFARSSGSPRNRFASVDMGRSLFPLGNDLSFSFPFPFRRNLRPWAIGPAETRSARRERRTSSRRCAKR